MKSAYLVMGLGALTLTGCGGPSGTGNTTAATGSTASAPAAGGMPAGFKATDACSVIDAATMASVLGVKVVSADLGLVHEANGSEAATSECSYVLDSGRASVMTRWSPIADNTADAIATAKSATKASAGAFGATVEDVAGLGKASFWVGKINQLQSFIGEDRMVLITVPDSPDAKDKAIALAKKMGA